MIKLNTSNILCFFPGRSVQDLWATCHCQMLWEAIKREDARVISINDLPPLLRSDAFVIIAPEPLPAIYMGIDPAFKVIDKETIVNALLNYPDVPWVRSESILEVEPIYLFAVDFSWMIALTTENTVEGKRLCVVIER